MRKMLKCFYLSCQLTVHGLVKVCLLQKLRRLQTEATYLYETTPSFLFYSYFQNIPKGCKHSNVSSFRQQ